MMTDLIPDEARDPGNRALIGTYFLMRDRGKTTWTPIGCLSRSETLRNFLMFSRVSTCDASISDVGRGVILGATFVVAWFVRAPSVLAGDDIRLNQIQVIGTHNSYHIEPSPGVRALIAAAGEERAQGLEYTHATLDEQFSKQGIRQIELDIFNDPDGGRYAQPSSLGILRRLGRDAGSDHDPAGALTKPGMKVLHVQDVDFRTTVLTLVDALRQVRSWSRANPRHVPIMILLELKGEPEPALPTRPVAFHRVSLQKLEAEILSVFQRGEIITPDEVRGTFATLPDAIRKRGWPRLDEVRGRVLFALDNEDDVRDLYLEGHPALKERLLFVSVPESHVAAAWLKINDSINDFDRIRRLVGAGFLVRTRADADTREARSNDPTRRDKALASGAQFVSTDYPVPDSRLTTYCVQFPGRVVARSNPVCGNRAWDDKELE
jgi:hypothetical protein